MSKHGKLQEAYAAFVAVDFSTIISNGVKKVEVSKNLKLINVSEDGESQRIQAKQNVNEK